MGTTSAVIGGTIIITGTSVLKDIHEGKPPVLPVVTGFLLGSALLLVAFASPPLAKALALMGVVGALATNGNAALGVIGSVHGS